MMQSAVFRGRDRSMGYRKGYTYYFTLQVRPHYRGGRSSTVWLWLMPDRTIHGTSCKPCPYSSLASFHANWLVMSA